LAPIFTVEAVQALVELGANVNAQNRLTGASPLHMAAQSHKATIDARLKVTEILIGAGARCEQTDNYGSMPLNLLQSSTEGNDVDEKTKLLLDRLRPSQPMIHEAVNGRNISLLETLLSDDSNDVNEIFQNETPLSRVIRIFVEEVSASSNETNETAIVPMMKMLLKRGADPNCLIVEASTGAPEEVAKEAALHKLACTLRDIYRTNQQTELAGRKIEMIHGVVNLLIEYGSNIPMDTILLLHQAARLNECSFATFLLDKLHIDPNTKGRQGMTPLHFAARSGKLEMLVSNFLFTLLRCLVKIDSQLHFILAIAFGSRRRCRKCDR
jgi:ankyrin repeat protein